MDYKKALAATAVTSAAFVVPIVAQAEETGQTPLTGSNIFEVTYTYTDGTSFNGDGSAIFDKKVKAKVISLPDMTDAIVSYQWYIVDGTKYEAITDITPITPDKTIELTIPYKSNGKQLALELITEKGEHLWSEDNLAVAPFEVDETKLNIEFLVNGKTIIIDDQSKKSETLSSGDNLTVKNFAVKGINGEVLSSEHYKVTYKWYAVLKDDEDEEKIKDEDEAKHSRVKVQLPNVTGSSYTIPYGTHSEYAGFYVQAVLEIPTLLMIDTNSYSLPIEKYISLDVDPATELNEEIEQLIDPDSYGNKYEYNGSFDISEDEDEDEQNFTEDQLFEAYINSLISRYENLSTNSKNQVTNYSILQDAKNDIQVVKTLITELTKFDSNVASTTNHAELIKQFDTIMRSYNALTPLQHSIVNFTKYSEQYLYQMQELLKKSEVYPVASDESYSTVNQVKALNNDITALINNDDKAYNLDTSSENILEDFVQQIKDLTSRTKLIDKNYQPLLYTSILKTAESDVKKANAVITKMQQIPKAKTEAKQIAAIVTAKKAYDQLTPYQVSLVNAYFENNAEDDVETLFTLPESAEEPFDVSDIVTNIGDLKVDGVYSLTASELEDQVKQISAEYLSLSAKAKKLVSNYSVLTQVKKDYTAANKVIALMEKAEDAQSSIDASDDKNLLKNQKAALTKYTSAYKALIKLTNAQISIVQNGEIDVNDFIEDYNELNADVKTPVFKEDDEKATEKFDDSKSGNVSELIVSIQDLFDTSSTIDEIEAAINEAKAEYKKLTSYEKKLVYNYAYLSVASSHVSKAKTVQTKLKTATAKNDFKKIAAAITSYNKLDAVQQKIIEVDYVAAQTALGVSNDDLGELSELLSQLSNEQYYTFDNINKVSKLMDVLTSKEQKALSDYDKYQTALKDLKAVNTLISKVEKLGDSPSYSKKDSIITSYQKLTKKQLLIFGSSNHEAVQKITQWTSDLQSNTSELNTLIGSINISGEYIVGNMNGVTTSYTSIGEVDDQAEGTAFLDSFDKFLVNIEAVYKKLDSKEKKLVTHYSMIATAKKDSKAVRSVVKLALAYEEIEADEDKQSAAFKKWNNAYSKLTYQQQTLFDSAMPNFKE